MKKSVLLPFIHEFFIDSNGKLDLTNQYYARDTVSKLSTELTHVNTPATVSQTSIHLKYAASWDNSTGVVSIFISPQPISSPPSAASSASTFGSSCLRRGQTRVSGRPSGC